MSDDLIDSGADKQMFAVQARWLQEKPLAQDVELGNLEAIVASL